MLTVDRIYKRYDYLAEKYANKLWNNTDMAIEREDFIQELRIRLFTSIQTYLLKWRNYRLNNGIKPIPIEFYLKTTMVNKSRDLIGELSSIQLKLSIEDSGMQFGTTAKNVDMSSYDIKIDGQSLLDLFRGREKTIMKLYFIHDFEVEKVLANYKDKAKKEKTRLSLENGATKIKNFLESEREDAQEFIYFELQD